MVNCAMVNALCYIAYRFSKSSEQVRIFNPGEDNSSLSFEVVESRVSDYCGLQRWFCTKGTTS